LEQVANGGSTAVEIGNAECAQTKNQVIAWPVTRLSQLPGQ
jgi:hypothetical protein